MSRNPITKKKSRVRSIWDRAQLLIAFHRDPARKKRNEPYLWPPKGAVAGLRSDAADQETFVLMRGKDRADDVQLKLRSDRIIARRHVGTEQTWTGVEITNQSVRVLVSDIWIRIDGDGMVTREDGDSTTYVEGDGAIVRLSDTSEIIVSPDGAEMIRQTSDRIDIFKPEGVLSKMKTQQVAGDPVRTERDD